MKNSKKKGRANGHGTLERRDSGLYVARWVAHGKRFSKSTGTCDLREAKKKLEEFTAPYRLASEKDTLAAVRSRIEGVDAELRAWRDSLPSLSVNDAFEAFKHAANRPFPGPRTMDGYAAYHDQFRSWLTSHRPDVKEMRKVSRADVEAWAADFTATHSNGTFNKHLNFLKMLWRVIMEADEAKDLEADTRKMQPAEMPAKIESSPWDRIHPRHHVPHSRRELTVQELSRVISTAEGEMRTLFAVGIYTGLRLGDVVNLSWSSVDLVRGIITLQPRKTASRTGKKVAIPIHRVLGGILSSFERNGEHVLPDLVQQYRKDPTNITNAVQSHFASCGIETGTEDPKTKRKTVDVGFHSLRHTFVSLSANAGASLAIVQSMVGHSSADMTRHYFHESEEALRSAVDALPCLGGIICRPEAEKPATGVLEAFCAMVDGMDADTFTAAMEYMQSKHSSRAHA